MGISKIILISTPILIFLLDLLIGDPSWLPHPVILMGKAINVLEGLFREKSKKTEQEEIIHYRELIAGRVVACLLPMATLLITGVIYIMLVRTFSAGHKAGLVVLLALDCFWGFQSIAVRDMLKESRNVYGKLSVSSQSKVSDSEDGVPVEVQKQFSDSLEGARKAVGRIVGRDTAALDKGGIIKAAVESVAESFSDGFAAPMLYYSIGGAPLALCYKSINTMDSMIGYKNEKYLYFGQAAARLDDAANFLPSRIAALFIIGASFLMSFKYQLVSGARAFRIWRRDRRNHASPNSAQTEAAMAGALGVRLAGGAWYFGEYYEKPYIGDAEREIEDEDILRANRIYLAASVIGTVFAVVLRGILVLVISR